jgi:hypothetical protein
MSKTENTLGENKVTTTERLNGTIYEVQVETGKNTSNIWYTNLRNVSDNYSVTEEPKDIAQSYASAEDCAFFAMRPARVLSAKYDKDNPGGYCSYLCDENASHCFYEITCWEDNQNNPVLVQDNAYNTDTAYVVGKPLYSRKQGDDHTYWQWDKVKDLKEGCGVSVLFTRQTRGFYKEWMNVQDPFEVKDTYTYKGKQVPYTVDTGKES